MPIRYFFKQLLLPPGGLLLLLLAAWWLRRRAPRLAALCFVLGFGGLWLLSLPVTVEWAGRALEREAPLERAEWADLAQRAQAIVVLGAGREQADPGWGSDQPSYLALERLRFAARLAKASGLPILASGGLHYGQPPSEAQLAAEALQRDFSTPTRWLEERSRTTWENVVAACFQCNSRKGNRTPQQAGMPLLAVPYRPSWVEHLILSNRNILADQMAFLKNQLPKKHARSLN